MYELCLYLGQNVKISPRTWKSLILSEKKQDYQLKK